MLRNKIEKLRKRFLEKQPQILLLLWLVVVLFLVKQTGYFAPYLEVTFLLISFVIWVSAALFLHFSSRVSLSACIIMWIIAMGLAWLGIAPWAERASLYAFGFLSFASLQMFFELLTQKKIKTS